MPCSVSWLVNCRLWLIFDITFLSFFLEPYESVLSHLILPNIVRMYIQRSSRHPCIQPVIHSVISHTLPPTSGPGYRRDDSNMYGACSSRQWSLTTPPLSNASVKRQAINGDVCVCVCSVMHSNMHISRSYSFCLKIIIILQYYVLTNRDVLHVTPYVGKRVSGWSCCLSYHTFPPQA